MLLSGAWFPKTLPCDVTSAEGTVTVDCTDRRLTEVPRGIPGNATNLTLSINNIPHIYPTSFDRLENLQEIDFRCNCMPVKLGPKNHVCTRPLQIQNGSFAALKRLKSLYLDANQLVEVPRGLPATLTLLSLEANRIFSIQKASFSELGNIEVLYLGQNCYYRNPCNVSYEIERTAFLGLKKLTILSLKSNNITQIPPNLSSTLKELYIYNNMIQEIQEQDLSGLPNLEILDLSGNCPRCYNAPYPCIPCPMGSIQIHSKAFDSLENLRILRLHSNSLQSVPSSWFKNIKNLKELDLSQNFLMREIGDAQFLTLIPSLCNCEAVWFVWWINQTQVTIPLLATDVTCAGPGAHRGRSVVFLDLYTCELDTSYLILYALSASAVLGLMVFTVMSHLYFWDVWYSYHYCTAKLKGYRRLSSPAACYDAFIAYDSEDPAVNEWVLQELVERLENQKARQFNLCLEGRDWLPGQPVFDNLSQSIQLSKKTIFVLTHRYIRSGRFKTTFYMAHQRLLDEKMDVIILIFLEKVLQKSRYVRLRKRLCRSSVLEWPTNPQSQPYFWHCLKNAIATSNSLAYNKLLQETV
ncbi:hypothetical protein HGM15179_000634 [Zosterops borbonicus]|uniref:TIR domain-containing protein n=1 Tax=Zosterops borbonicus TaxID=364589 RepID=A0A8K1LUF0_9PASS|nr:hypothetical protein HGM15179_000634 [Zosterops borbonicus]